VSTVGLSNRLLLLLLLWLDPVDGLLHSVYGGLLNGVHHDLGLGRCCFSSLFAIVFSVNVNEPIKLFVLKIIH
jgi:hypothetical protein